jgi:hypothetical protein
MKANRWANLMVLACVILFACHEARAFYNPSTGRWLSRDPITEKGGAHLYGFVNNDPIRKVDKLGRNIFGGPLGWPLPRNNPWERIGDALCPFRCGGSAYNPLTHCCCKKDGREQALNRQPIGTGVYSCDIPLSHSWVYVSGENGLSGRGYGFWSKNYDNGFNSGCSGAITDALSVGKVKDDGFDPVNCREIKLSPCKYSIAAFRKGVVRYWEEVEKGALYILGFQTCFQHASASVKPWGAEGCGGK